MTLVPNASISDRPALHLSREHGPQALAGDPTGRATTRPALYGGTTKTGTPAVLLSPWLTSSMSLPQPEATKGLGGG